MLPGLQGSKKDETIEVPSVGGREPRVLSRQTLSEIIEPRVEEILTLVQNELVRMGYEKLVASGVVLTGGSTIMEGMPELAEQVFNLPVQERDPRSDRGIGRSGQQPHVCYGSGPGPLRQQEQGPEPV